MKIEFGLYDPALVKPMRDEVLSLGFKELKSVQDVDSEIKKSGYSLVFVNSVCGCAAGKARPGLKLAVERAEEHGCLPENLITAFAGMERNAVSRLREYFGNYPPSSPQIALMKGGITVAILQRSDIENSDAEKIADKIFGLLQEHCTK